MVTGNEYIFEDIFQARDYILKIEQEKLKSDTFHQKPPLIFPISDFNLFSEKLNISPIPMDSLENPNAAYFNCAEESKFIMTRLMSGRYSLKPNLRKRKFLFRGENEFHNPCKPNLFRNTKKSYFLDSMIYGDEMFCLILSHPLVQLLDMGVMLNGEHIRFEMNLYGLIQHYYNKTALIDLTSDINVALFFATQQYDRGTDSYSPIIDENHKVGVLYYYAIDYFKDFKPQLNGEQLSTIGLQVFPRSGEQKGFLYQCNKNTNFNELPQLNAFQFKHNADIAKKIYKQMNGGKVLFPHDVLQTCWGKKLRNKDLVSLDAIKINLTRNEEETIESIRIKLKEYYNIEVGNYKPALTANELQEYYEAVKNECLWENFCDQIHIPGDKSGKMMSDLLDVPNKPEYEWAFKEGIPHSVDYDKGFLLKKYKHILA
jgi:FRG domain protein